MSGQQIGTAVGFVVGAFFGYPQLGAMIGGMIGGAIDPTEIEGPHIGDGAQQSSQEGVPISWILGTYGWVQGNIVQKSERREIRKEDDGKGSGQVQVTYEAHQDFCLMVCESSETRNSTVVGPLIIRVNGKIVYDMRPGANFGAENAKFLEHHTFYVGNEDQVPDPTMEAITGVGNTPSYRGVFTCVCRDINLSQYGDAIPTYEWVMVSEGGQDTIVTESYEAYRYSEFQDADYPLVQPEIAYLLSNASRVTEVSSESYPGPFSSIQEALDLFPTFSGGGFHYIGYKREIQGGADVSAAVPQASILDSVNVYLTYVEEVPAGWIANDWLDMVEDVLDNYPEGTLIGDRQGIAVRCYYEQPDPLPPGLQGITFVEGDVVWCYTLYPVNVLATRIPYAPGAPVGDPCTLGVPVQLPDSPGYVIDCDGNITPSPTYSEAPFGLYLILVKEDRNILPGNVTVFDPLPRGPVLEVSDPQNTQAFWEAAAAAAGIGGTYGVDYPIAVFDGVWLGTVTVTDLTNDTISVAEAINRICVRGGLTIDQVDTTDIDQTLMGYGISNTYDGADCIRPLLTAYGLYGADYDAKLRFHKLGENVDIVIDPGEMIAGESHTDEAEREQAVEYPRVIWLNYVDPVQDYSARPQPWRRISPDVRSIGEETVQVPVVMMPDTAAQTVDTYGKRATARAQGSRKFSVPFAGEDTVYLRLHPGKAFGLDGRRWVIDNLSLEDGEIAIEASFDRQSAYTSNVTAIPALPPTPPASNIGGVTLFAGMNLPRLRSRDSTPGMYIAVAGLLPSWPGCFLQMSIDDGETWTTAFASMTQQSVMGYLTAPIDETPGATLSVNVHGGQLNSITDNQFTNGGNPSTVLTNAVAEILQFQTATELEPNEYDLTDLGRGRLGTTATSHLAGDRFVQLENVYFLPLDISLAGKTIKFRPVTFGTIPENNATYDVVFLPQFTGPQIVSNLTVSGISITVSGQPIYVVT